MPQFLHADGVIEFKDGDGSIDYPEEDCKGSPATTGHCSGCWSVALDLVLHHSEGPGNVGDVPGACHARNANSNGLSFDVLLLLLTARVIKQVLLAACMHFALNFA